MGVAVITISAELIKLIWGGSFRDKEKRMHLIEDLQIVLDIVT